MNGQTSFEFKAVAMLEIESDLDSPKVEIYTLILGQLLLVLSSLILMQQLLLILPQWLLLPGLYYHDFETGLFFF